MLNLGKHSGCYALPMISIGTMEGLHNQNHALALYCLSCDRWGEANLDRLIQIGKGNKPITEARFRCRDCGEIVVKQVRPPVPSSGEAVAFTQLFLLLRKQEQKVWFLVLPRFSARLRLVLGLPPVWRTFCFQLSALGDSRILCEYLAKCAVKRISGHSC